jgi:ring-1,2-phenylacetyl-CoA epoxidase subunit PaaC
VLSAATLDPAPFADQPATAGTGRDGVHGAELTELLAEMQAVARALPGGVW